MQSKAACAALLLTACVGTVPDSGVGAPTPAQPMPAPDPTMPPTPVGAAAPPSREDADRCGAPVRPRARVRRLTRREYAASVRELVGVDPSLELLPVDPVSRTFDTNPDVGIVSRSEAEKYQVAARAIALDAQPRVAAALPCASADASCLAAVDGFVARAFRRPLSADEQARYRTFFTTARQAGGHAAASRLLVQAVLQSPGFLYRTELGAPASAPGERTVGLEAHELASALSFLLRGTPPDAELLAAARTGRLASAADVEAHARRLLSGANGVRRFFEQWLELPHVEAVAKDPATYPEFSPALARAMAVETLDFVERIVWQGDRTLATLFTSSRTVAGGALAALYGHTGVTAPTTLELDPAQRSGLLTQASLLAMYGQSAGSSPLYRGKFVAEKLFCTELPPPPEGANQSRFAAKDATPREDAEARLDDPLCGACHRLMDRAGFGLEQYDGIGRFRTHERGKPVDAQGELLVSGDVDGPFTGARALGERVAASARFRACFSAQLAEFALGVDRKTDDLCLARDPRLAAAGGDLRELLVAVVTSAAFRERLSSEQP